MLKQKYKERVEESRPYSQVCVWEGTTVPQDQIKDFEKQWKSIKN